MFIAELGQSEDDIFHWLICLDFDKLKFVSFGAHSNGGVVMPINKSAYS